MKEKIKKMENKFKKNTEGKQTLLPMEEEKTKNEDKVYIILGKIFRPLFYIALGMWGYSFISGTVDIPLSELNLGEIASFIFGLVIIIYAIRRLFTPPEFEEEYAIWGSVVSVIFFLGLLVIFFWYLFSKISQLY